MAKPAEKHEEAVTGPGVQGNDREFSRIAEIPMKDSLSQSSTILRYVVGPALTVSALVLVVGEIWLRILARNVRLTQDYLNDIQLAGDMSSYGLIAFVVLVVAAVALLSSAKAH